MSPRKTTPPDLTDEEAIAAADKLVAALADVAAGSVDDTGETSTADPTTAKRPVIAKLAQIMASLPTLLPEGRNAHFGYNFIKDTQVSGVIRPRMARLGLMLIPDVLSEEWVETKTSRGGTSYVTKLHVQFTIIDAESGDMIIGSAYGYGDDAGDKGANKALTAAEKYFLLKLFQIGGEDLEDDARADQRAADRESGPAPVVVTNGNTAGNVARGGVQDRISATQQRAIGAMYAELREKRGWTAETFITFIDETLGDALDVPDGKAASDILNAYIKSMSGEDAGKMITAMADAKDEWDKEEEPGGGYPG